MLKVDIYWDLRSTDPHHHTGVGRHVIEVVSRLNQQSTIDVRVLLASDQSSLWCDQAKAYGWETIQTSILPLSNKMLRLLHGFSSIKSVERICKTRDLVYSPMELVLHTGAVPFINTIHGLPCFETTLPRAVYRSFLYRFERLKQAWFLRRCRQRCRRVYAVSDYLKNQLEARFSFNSTQLHTVYNGAIDLFFQPLIDTEESALDSPANSRAIRFLSVGGVNAFDGGTHLVRVASLIRETYPSASIRIVGDRHEEPWYSQLKAMPQIEWVGFLEPHALHQEMQQATALLYLPDVESFGIIGVEAMAVGLPILAHPSTALPEVLGDAALWVDLDDASSLIECLKIIVTDNAVRKELILKGQQRADRYRWSNVVERVVEGFQQVSST